MSNREDFEGFNCTSYSCSRVLALKKGTVQRSEALKYTDLEGRLLEIS